MLTAWHSATRPNIVILFADDLGWGDLQCYGHPTVRSQNIDALARNGLRFTQWYSASSVCSPSRAALLTGRLPVRVGLTGLHKPSVLTVDALGGLPDNETTLAELLKTRGYTTGIVGKWHLGQLRQYLPLQHGFDFYYGLPYSNDMSGLYGVV